MLQIRRSEERGRANLRWLDSFHTFSFGSYFDPSYMGYGSLRVINEDRVIPGEGFATHSHQDMEIVTYVLSGALQHKDSLGNGSIIKPGDVQRMSAGTGISHSEYNASATDPVHLLQIWILPERSGIEPSYEQTYFEPSSRHNQLRLVGSQDGREGSVVIHQDANLYASKLDAETVLTYSPEKNRQIWIQLALGEMQVNEETLKAGDAAAITQVDTLRIQGIAPESELLVFDLAS